MAGKFRLSYLLTIILFINSSIICRPVIECENNIDKIYLHSEIDSFFIVYKPTNWWVYKNKNNSVDSIYVSNYTKQLEKNTEIGCGYYEVIRGQLNSTFFLLPNDSVNKIAYWALPNNESWFKYEGSEKTSKSFRNSSILSKQLQLYSIDSISLNGVVYFDILTSKTTIPNVSMFFSKKIGLVGWSTISDTFNLIRHKIY